MIMYGYNSEIDFYLNGKHFKAGYILIKKADTMHKKRFKWFFDQDLPRSFTGGGFAYQNGQWKHN